VHASAVEVEAATDAAGADVETEAIGADDCLLAEPIQIPEAYQNLQHPSLQTTEDDRVDD
jgi:hypothetical protein